MVGSCPALTKARCSQFGYWSSHKGGYLDLADMARLQGFAAHQVSQTYIIIGILKVNHTCVIESDLIPPGSLASGWPDGGAICRVLGQCSDAHSCEAHPATCLGCSQALACGCTALLEGLKPRSSMTLSLMTCQKNSCGMFPTPVGTRSTHFPTYCGALPLIDIDCIAWFAVILRGSTPACHWPKRSPTDR